MKNPAVAAVLLLIGGTMIATRWPGKDPDHPGPDLDYSLSEILTIQEETKKMSHLVERHQAYRAKRWELSRALAGEKISLSQAVAVCYEIAERDMPEMLETLVQGNPDQPLKSMLARTLVSDAITLSRASETSPVLERLRQERRERYPLRDDVPENAPNDVEH